MDVISAQAIWVTILRFMGDMAESKYDNDDDDDELFDEVDKNKPPKSRPSVMHNLTVNLSKTSMHSKEYQEALNSLNDSESDHQRLIRRTLKRKTKLPEILRKALDNSQELEYYHQWLGKRSSNLEKLHFIIGHGILKSELRDEIYCQICKQLSDNPYQTSFAKGWILLSLCLGCFPPSAKLEKYLRRFIQLGPELYAPYCENRLVRTLKNGIRTQPPSWLELHATRNKDIIVLNVFMMDGSAKKLQIDSASTARESVEQLARSLEIIDHFGFSIVISLYDKIMSLGNGREHIMDAISNCEQYAKEQGQNERKAPWKLYLRKEIFTPWYNPAFDEIATNLIYRQVIRGVNFGEYRCKSEKDIAMICALQYYADNGEVMDVKNLRKSLPDYLPKDLLVAGEKVLQNWERIIIEAFGRNNYVKNKLPQKNAKEDIVVFAQLNWPMMFSRFFEAVRIAGPKLINDTVIIAINSAGVFLVDETEQVLAEFSYPEILSAHITELDDANEISDINEVTIKTVQKEDYTFKCYEAKDIFDLIQFILENLKARSIYGVALNDYSNSSDDSKEYLQLCKGDLIKFDKGINGAELMKLDTNAWSRGETNGKKGQFAIDMIYIIPTILKPSDGILKLYKDGASVKSKRTAARQYNTLQRQRMYTLQKFAQEHFRPSISSGYKAQGMHTARPKNEDLWRHSRDILKAPLLKKLQKDQNLFNTAVGIFNYILKYMGETARGKVAVNTDYIFKDALKNEELRDEIYCQIMKQLTDNKMIYSEERAWDLMWLASGVMFPSSMILKELTEFLRTRTHPLAAESLKRVRKTIAIGQRKYPPYIIEVEAIQNRCMHIYHKIYFPDDTVEAFEIQSSTRSSDLIASIAKRLDLKIFDGFSLFIKIFDKAFSIPNEDFIFDFITELVNWMKETMPTRSTTGDQQISFKYQIFFMKKLWVNTIPGRDSNADMIFYYPQEVPKYLNGYYKVSKDEAIKMGALLYRIKFQNTLIPLQKTQEILPKIVPEDIIHLQKADDWRKSITTALSALGDLDEIAAKKKCLEEISKQETFGSTFFVVKQTNDPNLPEAILIAINRHGFNIIDPRSKEIIVTYGFSDLNFWSSGNTFFHISFGNMIGASKLLCTTTQGYKMDNLLSSYIKYFQT